MTKVLVLDVENSVDFIEDIDEETGKLTKVIDNAPFNGKNRLVAVGWRKIEDGVLLDYNRSIFFHNEYKGSDSPKDLQDALDWADEVVGHNVKYDLIWLLESGFKLDRRKLNDGGSKLAESQGPYVYKEPKAYCTMVGEYILARGVTLPISLEQSAIRRNVTHKKAELTEDLFKQGIGFEAMPLPIVEEYLEADVTSAAELYLVQQRLWLEEENHTLVNIVTLMNEMLLFLVEIERNGIKIDRERLNELKIEYETELKQLEEDLQAIATEVMGDTPINLTSPLDISKLVYSREVVDPERHKRIFKLGKGLNGKPQYPPYMTEGQFNTAVRSTTRIVKKTTAHHCTLCNGKGKIRKLKKDGSEYKKDNICPTCKGLGFTLTPTNSVAGLRLIPERPMDASVHGFAVSKLQMDRLLAQAERAGKEQAIQFLKKKKRLNAVNVYLNSFVGGMERWTRPDGILHATFNQTIAKTGRLSSSRPNFQNQPKEKKFPIRGCVVSRFEGGVITECDFSGLEFVVAGELSRDPQIIADILNGKDIHRQTASIVHRKPKEEISKDERNEVKPYTFAPLYGGQGANEPPHIKTYFEEFFNIYKRHGEWQKEMMEDVISQGFVRTPSGREYEFPGTKRIKNGRTTNATAIVNYPVQGFATGDIVPLACVRAYHKFKQLGLRSVLILTVHDSLVADTHPDEKAIVKEVFEWATTGCVEEIKERWNYEMILPLKSETSQGINWMDMKEV